MNRLQSLTKNQRDAVSDFLVAITRELPPSMMVKLMRKVIIDIQEMAENILVPLRVNSCYVSVMFFARENQKRNRVFLFNSNHSFK